MRNPNFFAGARVRNPSRCFVKRSAVLFFESTRTHGSAECVLLQEDIDQTSKVVASGLLDDFHCVFLHGLL